MGKLTPKLKIQVGPVDDKFGVICNKDEFQEVHPTQQLAILAGLDHRKKEHPTEEGKVRRRAERQADKIRKKLNRRRR
jgi:hypothetical protein